MLKDTHYDRADLDKVWLQIVNSEEQSDGVDILQRLHPLIVALFAHVDDLQAEVNMLKERVKRS